MARNFSSFLDSYFSYAQDGFCPDKFHYWTGISMIAAALERKCWTVMEPAIHYPNLFIMLVAVPGDGKSTAGERGIDILQDIQHPSGPVMMIPEKITEAEFHSIMTRSKSFFVGSQGYEQTAAFYFASEASNALTEISGGGDFFPVMTQAYDCKKEMRRATKARGTEIIRYPCMNVLACTTFDHLKTILTEKGIMGGFASRFLYVVNDKQIIRTPKFNATHAASRDVTRRKLVEDLQEIYNMSGPFQPERAYMNAFEEWFPRNDRERYSKSTEKEQSFYARKHANALKLSMIYAASESSDMILRLSHWEKAIDSLDRVERRYNKVIAQSHSTNSQEGVNGLINATLKNCKNGCCEEKTFRRILQGKGLQISTVNLTITYMLNDSGELKREFIGNKAYLSLASKPEVDVLSSNRIDL